MMYMLRNSLRQYRRFWVSSLFILIGTAIGTLAVTLVLGTALDQASRRIDIAPPDASQRADLLITGQEQDPQRLYGVLRGIPEIAAVTIDTDHWIKPGPPLEMAARAVSMEVRGEVWHPPVLAGRFLTANDSHSDAEPVVVIGSVLARKWFAAGPAIDERIALPVGGSMQSFRVVGVVGVAGRITNWDEVVIIPGSYDAGRKVTIFQITVAPAAALPEVQEAVRAALVRELAGVTGVRQAMQEPPTSDEPAAVAALSVLSVLILVVAAVNSTNLAVFWVLRRRREMAIRQAVGATRATVVRMVLGEILILNLMGTCLALLGYAVIRYLDVTPLPLEFRWVHVAVGTAAAGISGLLAGIAPARRVARMDPVDAMRTE